MCVYMLGFLPTYEYQLSYIGTHMFVTIFSWVDSYIGIWLCSYMGIQLTNQNTNIFALIYDIR